MAHELGLFKEFGINSVVSKEAAIASTGRLGETPANGGDGDARHRRSALSCRSVDSDDRRSGGWSWGDAGRPVSEAAAPGGGSCPSRLSRVPPPRPRFSQSPRPPSTHVRGGRCAACPPGEPLRNFEA